MSDDVKCGICGCILLGAFIVWSDEKRIAVILVIALVTFLLFTACKR